MYLIDLFCKFLTFFKRKKTTNELDSRKTKTQLVREHLNSLRVLNTWEAEKLYGVDRLSEIIYRLRKQGMSIETHKSSTVISKKSVTITSYVY
jgi:hypothetical protein